MNEISARLGLVALLVLLPACDSAAPVRPVAEATEPTDDSLIAFTTQSKRDLRAKNPMPRVAVVPASGGTVTRLRKGSNPAWSPDGDKLVFTCHPGICTMNADGTDVDRITHPPKGAIDEEPDWGPDVRILFTRSRLGRPGGRDIFMIPGPSGREARVLGGKRDVFSPSWSPDGSHIAYLGAVGRGIEAPTGGFQLFVARWGSLPSATQLTTSGAARPDWSPDGSSIVFDYASAIWTIPAERGVARKLEPATTGEHPDTGAFASWSPDGERIAYTCEALGFGHHDLCSVSPDGTGRTTILATHANEAAPAWQPTDDATVMPDQATADAYPLAVHEGATYVFAPARGQLWGWCPQRAQRVEANDLPILETLIAISADEISGNLNTEDAYADAILASDAPGPPDFEHMIAKDCGSELVDRTVLVTLHLPRVDSASMGATTYFVSREPRGWVIWNMW